MHVRLLRVLQVAYRMVEGLLVNTRVVRDALFKLADLRVRGVFA